MDRRLSMVIKILIFTVACFLHTAVMAVDDELLNE